MAVNPEQWFDDLYYFGHWSVDYFQAPALLRFFDHVTGDQHDAGERPKLLHLADHKSWPWNYRSAGITFKPRRSLSADALGPAGVHTPNGTIGGPRRE